MFLLRLVLALTVALLLVRVGIALLRGLGQPVPEPPPPGELRRVRLIYRCGTCGTQVRMTSANDEHPEAPRHCMDEMDLVSTGDDL